MIAECRREKPRRQCNQRITRVWSLPFSGEEEGQALINNCSRWTHTTRSRKNQETKAPMLDLPYTFFILATLDSLMLVIRVRPVGRGKGIKYASIKKSRLIPTTPKARCLNVKASTRICVSRGKGERFT